MERKFLLLTFAVTCGVLLPSVTHAQAYLTGGSGARTEAQERGDLYRDQNEATPLVHEVDTVLHASTTDKSVDNTPVRRSESVRGMLFAQEHRSSVASVARSLIALADQENIQYDLATELRRIAKLLKTAEATTTTAIQRISSRGAIRSFFSGNDQANLEILISGLERTEDILDQLRVLSPIVEKTSDLAVFTVLIQTLEKDQSGIRDFVTSHQNTVSLPSWFGFFGQDRGIVSGAAYAATL